jgi:hypothetical protein
LQLDHPVSDREASRRAGQTLGNDATQHGHRGMRVRRRPGRRGFSAGTGCPTSYR